MEEVCGTTSYGEDVKKDKLSRNRKSIIPALINKITTWMKGTRVQAPENRIWIVTWTVMSQMMTIIIMITMMSLVMWIIDYFLKDLQRLQKMKITILLHTRVITITANETIYCVSQHHHHKLNVSKNQLQNLFL